MRHDYDRHDYHIVHASRIRPRPSEARERLLVEGLVGWLKGWFDEGVVGGRLVGRQIYQNRDRLVDCVLR